MEPRDRRVFLRSGHELLARGAYDAGCQFFAAYPAPATAAVCETMLAAAPRRRAVALTTAGDVAAAAYALGASARGAKAMTATSAGAWPRIADVVEYAVRAELPLVVVVVEQFAPTRVGEVELERQDVLLADLAPDGLVPVFTPGTPAECYELATAAFHWAERLRSPVVLRCDRDVVQLIETVDERALVSFPPATRSSHGAASAPLPERWPMRLPDAPAIERATASGAAMGRPIADRAEDLAIVRRYAGPRKADAVVIAFGATVRTALDAVRLARQSGRAVDVLAVLSLLPVPVERLRALTDDAGTVVVVAEENLAGQYRRLMDATLQGKRIFGVPAASARLTPHKILETIEEADWKVEYV